MLAVALAAAAPARATPGSRFAGALRGSRGAIACIDPMAAQAGIDVLDAGGNAVDAAVTVAFTLGVVRPESTGPGGGGFMVYRSADGSEVTSLDFRETAPADVTATYRQGPGIDDFTYLFYGGAGHRVVGVPGNVAGLAAALERHGTISLEDAIEPAAKIAEDGFVVSGELAAYFFLGTPYLRLFPATADVFLHGTVVQYPNSDTHTKPLIDATGDFFVLKQPDHAKSLRLIARDGPSAFYEGEIADLLVRDFESSGTLYPGDAARMTKEDLAAYRAVWRKPVRTTYRDHEVIGMPPPSSGGVLVAQTLNLLEGFDLEAAGASSADHLHYLTEAMKIALADREEYLADPDVVDVPVKTLTSRKYADERRPEIERFRTKLFGAGELYGRHTTHLSVIDEAGNAVAMTLTLNNAFGSGVVAPGTGFLLNNELLDFTDPTEAVPNPANAPAAGKRPRSSMSPTILVRDGKAVLAVGGAGGTTILRGAVQVVVNTVDFDMDVAEAIDAERIFPANVAAPLTFPPDGAVDVLDMEGSRVPQAVKDELARRGHRITGGDTEYTNLPNMEGVGVDLVTGDRLAYSDPRAAGGSAVQR